MSQRLHFCAVFVAAIALGAPAWAQVPSQLGYQGRLLKADGTAAQGAHQFTFALWPSVTGGTAPLWSDTYKVAVVDGLYSVQLGSDVDADGGVNPLPSSVFDGAVLHLEITVDGETLSPRQPVGSVAYAIKAGTATTATNLSGGTVDATSVNVNGNQVVDGTGHLTGAAAADFLKTAATSAPLTGNGTSTSPIAIPQCTSLVDGYLSATDWNTFNNKLAWVASNAPLSGAGTVASPLLISQSSTTANGYLSSTDWSTFNNKVSSTDPRLSDARDPLPGSNDYIQNSGTLQSSATFNVPGATVGTLYFGGKSAIFGDQGGAIELGGNNGNANAPGAVPYIDFHYGTGTVQDYNVRVINDANNHLSLVGNVSVTGTLVGAAKDTAGTPLRICAGRTPPGSTAWVQYSASANGVFVTVDTSGCGFTSTPIYQVNMDGEGGNWQTTGGSSAYNRTATGFTVYVYSITGPETPAQANAAQWHIEWVGLGN